ncbi:MAG: CpsD/CapB family tyrosine-protein kinase [Acholeplasmataceae bacterium]
MGKRKKLKELFVKENGLAYDQIYVKDNPVSFITESFQKLLVNLSYVNVDQTYKVIQFTSTLASEGKTTFVSNLSYLMAQKDKKILILDLDLRKPKIHKVFGVANEHGVTDYLSGKSTLEQVIKHSDDLNLDFMCAGEKTSAVTYILESTKLRELIKTLKGMYDYVFVDSPPVIAVSDSLYISRLSDGVLFLVGQKQDAKKGLVKEAIETLKKNETPIIGIAMIQVDLKDSAYGYNYGYRYGYTYEESESN